MWHVTWLVNGASHSWGNKMYKTSPPDESRNNWWVGLIALGMRLRVCGGGVLACMPRNCQCLA